MASTAVLSISNPKRPRSYHGTANPWYDYYAGYSVEFVRDVLRHLGSRMSEVVLDPWNGSGTTTQVAEEEGHPCYGFDLNPVMVVIAKTRALDPQSARTLRSLGMRIVDRAEQSSVDVRTDDALYLWLTEQTAATARAIEDAVLWFTVEDPPRDSKGHIDVDWLSNLASFFYAALFITIRSILTQFRSSNPTWLRTAGRRSELVEKSRREIMDFFLDTVNRMAHSLQARDCSSGSGVTRQPPFLSVASSDRLPLPDHTIDLVISSPPYCTRIDYTMATRVELGVLGYSSNNGLRQLRESMIGAPTVSKAQFGRSEAWGTTCNEFLDRVQGHSSRASSTYYFKGFLQYFTGIFDSLKEIDRTLRPDGRCVFVVQDSYYKEVHNDLPVIFSEMGEILGWTRENRVDFPVRWTMAGVNSQAMAYHRHAERTETVLTFHKPNR